MGRAIFVAFSLGLVGLIALGFWLSSSEATPTPGPLADLESDLPRHVTTSMYPTTVEAVEVQSVPRARTKVLTVGRGDTLMSLLLGAGIAPDDAGAAVAALRKIYSPRDLRPGQAIRLALRRDDPREAEDELAPRLVSLSLRPNPEHDINVVRDDGPSRFVAKPVYHDLVRDVTGSTGRIKSSLFAAGHVAGVPTPIMLEVIRAFSYDVDVQREVREADDFELLYESHYDEDGRIAKNGAVIFAALTLSGRRVEIYRFTPRSGRTDYFHPEGTSVRKALLRTPIDGARMSSGFGMRKHPILGYSKMHRGVDFAAPPGTPIYAAGDGTIERIGHDGSYGRYIRIKHNSKLKTAYAHMRRFARGLKAGQFVKQGQVIGYVGSSGRSTGPHLHYELLVGNQQVDPSTVDMPSGEHLSGDDLEDFLAAKARIDRLRGVDSEALVASNEACGAPNDASKSADSEKTSHAPAC